MEIEFSFPHYEKTVLHEHEDNIYQKQETASVKRYFLKQLITLCLCSSETNSNAIFQLTYLIYFMCQSPVLTNSFDPQPK